MLETGEYVRDCDGFIVKVNDIVPDKDSTDIWYEEKTLKGTWKSMIVNYSKNIIDLIEEGDYVNGQKVKMHYESGVLKIPKKIKTILTKEQYEANCYKVKEE